jgi:Legionella pneumophila major outer membrane protein precursor
VTISRASKISALVASAAAVSPVDKAMAQFAPALPGTMTYSFEGGFAFSNLSTTNFPGGAIPFIPQSFDKLGLTPQSSGNLNQGWRNGGYGAFSVARNFDAVNDWRFSAGFYVFGSKEKLASATQEFVGPEFDAINSATVTERDRFRLYTADFDFGRMFSAGLFQVRAFAGLRGAYIGDGFDSSVHTVGTDKLGFLNTTTTVTDTTFRGRAAFYGVGPRVGFEFFTGSIVGLVGNLSGAVLGGQRNVSLITTGSSSTDGGPPFVTLTQLTNNEFSWVANVSGSLGVAWQFAPNGQIVVGYKLDQWWNVRSNFAFAGFDRKEDILIQTPFVKATLRF